MKHMFRMLVGVAIGLLLWLPAARAVPSYNIDGKIDDWGVHLELFHWDYWWWHGEAFDGDSFTPHPLGTIDFKVEDYWPSDREPSGGEEYDYEAIYFDDSPQWFYVGVISSHHWDDDLNGIWVSANGITISTPDFDLFATGDLGIAEEIGNTSYPNYFFEGAIAASRFGYPPLGISVSVYANEDCGNDHIGLSSDIDNPIPEPATILLMGCGLLGAAALRYVRRKSTSRTGRPA